MSWIAIWNKNKKFYGWRHIQSACDRLALRYDHKLPTRIVALSRGGLIPATIIANQLVVRHVYSVGISSYQQAHDGKETQGMFELYQRLPSNTPRADKDEVTLIVDDISDKGKTFIYAKEHVSQCIGGNIITMSLVMKPKTMFKPDYYDKVVPQSCWVVFPWERKVA